MAYKKFNFILFLNGQIDYYKVAFFDAFALSNVRVMNFNVISINGQLHFNFVPYCPANNPTAFRNIQNFNLDSPQAFAQDFETNRSLVFFFRVDEYSWCRSFDFFNYLRSNYPGCKLVCWLTNPVHYYQSTQKIFIDKASTDEVLSTFDCVLTYNKIDAMDYRLNYFEGPYSVLPFEQPKVTTDIFYVGAAKNRLEKILRAYESFKAAGFSCDFYINNIPNPPSIKADDLHFNHILSYAEVLKHVLRSRAVLDIMHTRNYGMTVRYFESLAYNKNFITDNAFYRQDRFASPKIFLIDRSLEIDKEKFMAVSNLSSNYRNEYSPLRMISFLESFLNS